MSARDGWVQVLLNAKAAASPELREEVGRLREQGHELDVRSLWESGEARRCAERAARDGARTVVAAGGDGTLHEVVNGLANVSLEECALGIVPFGTGNDFAGAFGVPENDPAAALRRAVEGEARAVDVVRVEDDRVFLNAATAGLAAEVTRDTPELLKKLLGGVAYSITGIVRALEPKAKDVTIRGSDGFEWSGTAVFIAIANGKRAGGGWCVAPCADPSDGRLELVLIPELPIDRLGGLLHRLLVDGETDHDDLIHASLADVEVRADAPLPWNLDGEPWEATSASFASRAGALRLRL